VEKKQEILYPLSNPLVFAAVMNDKNRCRKFIEKILPEKKVKDVRFPKNEYLETEKTILNGLYYKSVRLDVLFEDDSAWYDIEMQIEDEKNIPNRSRYYHASVDTHSLAKGDNYNNLKPCYVIFICMFDIIGLDEPIYSFEMFDKKLRLSLNDGRYTIILNTSCSRDKVPNELKTFFDYLNNQTVINGEDLFVDEMHREVMKHNRGKELIALMTLEEELKIRYNRGKEEGKAEGKREANLSTARNMKQDGIKTETICKYTGLSEEEVNSL